MFYWICPCGYENLYSGSKTTNVVVTCKSCKAVIKASSHKKPDIILENKEKTPNKLPRTTKNLFLKLPKQYTTSIVNRPSKIQIKIDDVNWVTILKIMDRGISTIRNKLEVKAKKGAYYFDFLEWTREFKKIESIAEIMKLLEVSGK